MQQAQYMINMETNEVSAYKEKHVQERSNFKPFYDAPPPIDRTTGLCILRPKADPLLSAEAEKKEARANVEDVEKVGLVVAAMMNMVKADFITTNGMPRLDKLEKCVGFPVTKDMRVEAFREYTLRKSIGE